MKSGDLIKHKRSATCGIIIKIFEFEGKRKLGKLVTVYFSGQNKPSTASLKILKDNWEVISDK